LWEDTDGSLWIGTNCALSVLKNGSMKAATVIKDFANEEITCLLPDEAGLIWLGTRNAGIYLCKNGSFSPLVNAAQQPLGQVHDLWRDEANRVWGATSRGLLLVDKGVVSHFNPAGDGVPYYFTALAGDGDGSIWLASRGGGVFRYLNGAFERFCAEDGLSHNDVKCLHLDINGCLWLGTGSPPGLPATVNLNKTLLTKCLSFGMHKKLVVRCLLY
jgi:ligand-binding sensor domain-containing protein